MKKIYVGSWHTVPREWEWEDEEIARFRRWQTARNWRDEE